MLLTCKGHVGNRDPLGAESLDHSHRLIGWYHLVFKALKEDCGTGKLLGEINRRTFEIFIASLWIWSEQPLQIARFKFVSVACERLRVADSEMTRPRLKSVPKRQGTQSCVATRASACHDQALAVYLPALHQVAGTVHAIVNIYNAPLIFQSFPILPAIACTATVVDVQNGKATTSPILNAQTQSGGRCRSWATMTFHDQRWEFIGGRTVVGILRPIKKCMSGQAFFSGKLDCPWSRKMSLIYFEINRPSQNLEFQSVEVESNDRGDTCRRAAAENRPTRCRADILNVSERSIQFSQFSCADFQCSQPRNSLLDVTTNDQFGRRKSVSTYPVHPLRHTEFRFQLAN